jgi:hypothetical protein
MPALIRLLPKNFPKTWSRNRKSRASAGGGQIYHATTKYSCLTVVNHLYAVKSARKRGDSPGEGHDVRLRHPDDGIGLKEGLSLG